MTMKCLSAIKLENSLLTLQGVRIQPQISDVPRRVTDFHFCRSQPKVRHNPQLFGLSKNAMSLLALDHQLVKNDHNTPLYLSGSLLLQDSQPLAHNYSGFQFGSWAGQLGDGRAHILGSINNGHRNYELQLKGSGMTPFSRHADGNSVVSSALRQFLASELMAGLGIPTTRAGSLVIADEPVKRDPFYDGRIKIEKAAIVLRISQTFLRFGSLEVCRSGGQMRKENPIQNRQILQPLCDYAIAQSFSDIDLYQTDPYQQLYKRLVKASAEIVALWQSVGFCHGVLNTDNMSLGGVTIDYGPFAFIDYFSKDFVSNASDDHERYSYRRQPDIIQWNLLKLAEAMDSLVPSYMLIEYLKSNFKHFYQQKYYKTMSDKLGLQISEESKVLIDQLIENMHKCGTHFTNFFRIVEQHSKEQKSEEQLINRIVSQSEPTEFYLNNLRVFSLEKVNLSDILQDDPAFNTHFITEQKQRQHMRIQLSNKNCKERNQSERQLWKQWISKYQVERIKSKQKTIKNPKYALLNFIAKQIQEEINQLSAQQSVKHLEQILDVFSNPYDKNEWFEQRYWKKAPQPVKLTCSS